jgi:hypothetical protein
MLDPVPVDKRCKSCRQTKILTEYEFSKRSKDGRAQICKECKEQKQYKICTCNCDTCKDSKMLNAAASLMELVLTRIEDGLEVSDDFKMLAAELAIAVCEDKKGQ